MQSLMGLQMLSQPLFAGLAMHFEGHWDGIECRLTIDQFIHHLTPSHGK